MRLKPSAAKTRRTASAAKTRETDFGRIQVAIVFIGILSLYRIFVKDNVLKSDFWNTGKYNLGVGPSSSSIPYDFQLNPLSIPQGKAENLPSVRVEEDTVDRKIYGGKGDKVHLGGFTDIDLHGISPAVWKHVVDKWTVQSVLDVGCGRGISTSWFVTHGLRTECVEGSHDAIEKNMVPDKSILTEHDFSRGPWWPEKTFDMVWSVEFLEHVNLHNHFNYIASFRKAAIIVVTSSTWGGWHHVEVHKNEWWITKYESYGFRFSKELTEEIRKEASNEASQGIIFPPNGEKLNAQHLRISAKVFINPIVAALPQHAHLFGEPGCYTNDKSKGSTHRECGKGVWRGQKLDEMETPLDPSYYPLKLDSAQDEAWYDIVKANIEPPSKEGK